MRNESFVISVAIKKYAKLLVIVGVVFLATVATGEKSSFSSLAIVGSQPAVSPDRKIMVSLRLLDDDADDFPTEILVRRENHVFKSKINFGLDPELLWNTQSTAFAITGSSEGANGQYHVDIFLLKPNELIRVPLTSLIEKTFGHPVKCGWPEVPNVAAIKWIDESRILVAAEIINHSNCDSFGTFQGFVVDVREPRVIRKYDQLTIKRLYGSYLGQELKNTDDECIRHPEKCFVSANHPGRKQ